MPKSVVLGGSRYLSRMSLAATLMNASSSFAAASTASASPRSDASSSRW